LHCLSDVRQDRSRPGDIDFLICRGDSVWPETLSLELAMSNAPIPRKSLRAKVQEHGAQLGLAVRVTIAAVLAFALSHLVFIPPPLWTVLTAVILTQVTFGRSVKATLDYLAGTIGGAIYVGAVSLLIPHANDFSLASPPR
jgi:uncharacterized membrane protein YccC